MTHNTSLIQKNDKVPYSSIQLLVMTFFCLITSSITAQDVKKDGGLKNKLPIISVAPGVFHFLGDVGYSKPNQPFLSKPGFQIELQLQTKSRLSFAAFLLSGQVFGEERDRNKALNFKASIVTEGIMLRYDFINRKRSDQVLVPYLTAGIEYVIFHTFADLKDSNGNPYQYWSDGTVRDIAQSDTAAYRAIKIHRDYDYETDMRDANLDGFGKYNQSALSFPIGAGVRFVISPRVSMHLSTVWHLVGSDLVDGVSKAGSGDRKGNSKNDKIIFSSVALRYDLSAMSTNKSKNVYRPGKADLRDVDFKALANEDADMDGIPDIKDDSSATPASKEVDAFGKPLDKDDDGIPDYRDLELNSAPNAVVTIDGVTITEEMIEEKFRQDSLAAMPALVEYIQSYDRLIQRKPGLEQEQLDKLNEQKPLRKQIPLLYRALDVDGNEYISPKEISNAIDDYMAGKSSFTIPEFYNLIDFFFMQN
ncbi:MAG: hypothetical protein EYC69_03560 [Bacteroidetes bacterium]|nr:MAG: hypothetical protein EYC69_03560 [Bacteroidota bacterium]